MPQTILFEDAGHPAAARVTVRFRPDFPGWQAQARKLLQAATPPDRIWWLPDDADAVATSTATTTATATSLESAASGSPSAAITVPRAFLDAARAAACHRAEDRWTLLYELLWRLVREERHLLQLHSDPLVARLKAYEKSVLRDVHKMKAFVRFKALQEPAGEGAGEPRYVAWFEPAHHIVEYAAPFFQRRFANLRWSILTPDRCAHWEGDGAVWFSKGVDQTAAPTDDALEEAWRMYYRSIFNPARLKVRAMTSEMPQKYWKNLPEARLIPLLVRDANQRMAGMQAQVRTEDEPRCGPRPASHQQMLADRLSEAKPGTLDQQALEAGSCRRCPLWEPATQTVWGEGPGNARIMLVGEQPGDREDLLGRPFVGPAGKLLDRALAEAGLDRRSLYLTNTVKHFKFKSRGKRRIHDKPSDAEALACLPWLQAEMSRIRPALVVCLGATAARAQLGRAVKVNAERGRVIEPRHGPAEIPALLVTFHPSYLLRLEGDAAVEDAYRKFVDDLRLAKAWTDRTGQPSVYT